MIFQAELLNFMIFQAELFQSLISDKMLIILS
jgi:hypothetical protein